MFFLKPVGKVAPKGTSVHHLRAITNFLSLFPNACGQMNPERAKLRGLSSLCRNALKKLVIEGSDPLLQ